MRRSLLRSGGIAGKGSGGSRWSFSRFCNFYLGFYPLFLALSRFSDLFLANPHSVLPGQLIMASRKPILTSIVNTRVLCQFVARTSNLEPRTDTRHSEVRIWW